MSRSRARNSRSRDRKLRSKQMNSRNRSASVANGDDIRHNGDVSPGGDNSDPSEKDAFKPSLAAAISVSKM